jgi:hypothetical protein
MSKTLILFSLLMNSIVTTFGQDSLLISNIVAEKTQIAINSAVKNFGTVEINSKTAFTFELTNLSEEPMVIWHVTTSCGCTTPTWTKSPVKKGKTGNVKVKYDSSKPGKFEKSIFVYTNFSDNPTILKIEGTVLEFPIENQKSKAGYSKSNVQMDPNLIPISK